MSQSKIITYRGGQKEDVRSAPLARPPPLDTLASHPWITWFMFKKLTFMENISVKPKNSITHNFSTFSPRSRGGTARPGPGPPILARGVLPPPLCTPMNLS